MSATEPSLSLPKGVVVNIEGDPVAQVARDRAEGFYQVMEEYPNIEVVKLADSQAPEKATSGVSNAIADAKANGKTVDLVNSPTDPATLGAIEALKTNDMWKPAGEDGHVFVISHDERENSKVSGRMFESSTINSSSCSSDGISRASVIVYRPVTGSAYTTPSACRSISATRSRPSMAV